MKPQHGFIAERAAAQHCAELLRIAPKADPLIAFARFGERLAEVLPGALSPWHGSIPPAVTGGTVAECAARELEGMTGTLSANSLLTIAGQPVLLSIGASAVFSLIDRAFGGRGAIPDPMPTTFPASCEVLVRRIEDVITKQIAIACDGREVAMVRRDEVLARLEPFAPDTRIATIDFAVTGDRALENWCFSIAAPLAAVCALLAENSPRAPVKPAAANPAAEPFCDVPLELRAELVDCDLPVATLAGLKVGSVLPVAVARKVPLRIGARTIAHGSVGECDDRAALQIFSLA